MTKTFTGAIDMAKWIMFNIVANLQEGYMQNGIYADECGHGYTITIEDDDHLFAPEPNEPEHTLGELGD